MATSSIARRRAAGISAYVGANGSGKSLCMVRDALPSLRAGRHFLSTVQLLDANGEPHPNCELLTSWRQLMHARNCEVLLDEVTGVASARQATSLPAQLQDVFMQLRRRNITLRWSSPGFMRADKMIREVTQIVTVCKGMVKGPPPPLPPGVEPDPTIAPWRSNRLFRFRSFDAADIEHVEAQQLVGVHARIKPVVSEWWFRGSDSAAAHAYRTLDGVTALDTLTDHGLCVHCGGNRPRLRCTCGDRSTSSIHQLPAPTVQAFSTPLPAA